MCCGGWVGGDGSALRSRGWMQSPIADSGACGVLVGRQSHVVSIKAMTSALLLGSGGRSNKVNGGSRRLLARTTAHGAPLTKRRRGRRVRLVGSIRRVCFDRSID